MADTGTSDRASVVDLLFTPLLEMGLARPRRMTVAEFEALQQRLEKRLAHMSAAGLEALRGWIEERAEGPLKNICPAEITILNVAREIEPEPEPVRPMIGPYMAGPAGKRAWKEHPLKAVALYRFVRRIGPPQGKWSWIEVAKDREFIDQDMHKCRRLAAEGDPQAERRLGEWQRLIDHVRSLVRPEDADAESAA